MVGNRLARSLVLLDSPWRRDEKRGGNEDVIWERENEEGEDRVTDRTGEGRGWEGSDGEREEERRRGRRERRGTWVTGEDGDGGGGGQKGCEWQNEESEEGREGEGGEISLRWGMNEASAAFLLRANLNNEAV